MFEGKARETPSEGVWAEIEDAAAPSETVHRPARQRDRGDPARADRAGSTGWQEVDVLDAGAGHAHDRPAALGGTVRVLEILRRRRKIAARVMLITVLLAGILSLSREPLFEAEASVRVHPVDVVPLPRNVGADESTSLSDEQAAIRSTPVAERVEQRLGSLSAAQLLSRVSVEADEAGAVLRVAFRDPYPGRARQGAQAFAEAYLDERRDDAEQARAELVGEIAAIDRAASGPGNGQARARRLEELNGRLTAVMAIEADPGDVIRPATLPTTPAFPDNVRNLGLGLVIGALLGVVAAVVADQRDDRVGDEEEVERRLGVPTLATVGSQRVDGHSQPVVSGLAGPGGDAAERFRVLRDHLPQQHSSLLVTSAVRGEGKAVVAANLAVAYAQTGHRVLLVCADLRDTAVHPLLGVVTDGGLMSVLAGTSRVRDVVRRVAGLPLLDVVPAGHAPEDPVHLLRPETVRPLLWRLARRYDLIIIDAPPVLDTALTTGLSGLADAVILTAATGQTRRRDLARATGRLRATRAHIAGTVILEFDWKPPQ